jgi:hypothetical protein
MLIKLTKPKEKSSLAPPPYFKYPEIFLNKKQPLELTRSCLKSQNGSF